MSDLIVGLDQICRLLVAERIVFDPPPGVRQDKILDGRRDLFFKTALLVQGIQGIRAVCPA